MCGVGGWGRLGADDSNYRRSTETGRVEAAGAGEETGCRLPGDPDQGNKGILKLSVVVTAQLCEYTKLTDISVLKGQIKRYVHHMSKWPQNKVQFVDGSVSLWKF